LICFLVKHFRFLSISFFIELDMVTYTPGFKLLLLLTLCAVFDNLFNLKY
jgi:hypothetical protein